MNDKMKALAEEIVHGRRLKREDGLLMFLTADLQDLCEGADRLRTHFNGNRVNLCTIINGKSGRCSEDCKFCNQSSFYDTACEVHGFLEPSDILAEAKGNEAEGVDRFAIVTACRKLQGKEFTNALRAFRMMHEGTALGLCASMGLLNREQFRERKDAGVSRYHINLETSKAFFPQICTTHTFDDKIRTIGIAKEEGFSICSGGIIGMGESWEDRFDMAHWLAELEVSSIPLNVLLPIPGTPLQDLTQLGEEEILRCGAMFKFINPEADLRFAAGRSLCENAGEHAFQSGFSAAITGNMLTTTGSTIQSDRQMLSELGRELV